MSTVFDELNKLNVNDHTEKKKTGGTELTYLSWTWAWAEVKKRYPNANYEIVMHDGLPYVYDENTGYMVFTNATIDGVTHSMWLPVMDGANKAMKSKAYEYNTKFGKKTCEAASMFDVNKTIMRCLVKNLAMFGLGLYIYAGEDLPEVPDSAYEGMRALLESNGIDINFIFKLYNVKSLDELSQAKIDNITKNIDKIKAKQEEQKA